MREKITNSNCRALHLTTMINKRTSKIKSQQRQVVDWLTETECTFSIITTTLTMMRAIMINSTQFIRLTQVNSQKLFTNVYIDRLCTNKKRNSRDNSAILRIKDSQPQRHPNTFKPLNLYQNSDLM